MKTLCYYLLQYGNRLHIAKQIGKTLCLNKT